MLQLWYKLLLLTFTFYLPIRLSAFTLERSSISLNLPYVCGCFKSLHA